MPMRPRPVSVWMQLLANHTSWRHAFGTQVFLVAFSTCMHMVRPEEQAIA